MRITYMAVSVNWEGGPVRGVLVKKSATRWGQC